jgi:hypothetical protein
MAHFCPSGILPSTFKKTHFIKQFFETFSYLKQELIMNTRTLQQMMNTAENTAESSDEDNLTESSDYIPFYQRPCSKLVNIPSCKLSFDFISEYDSKEAVERLWNNKFNDSTLQEVSQEIGKFISQNILKGKIPADDHTHYYSNSYYINVDIIVHYMVTTIIKTNVFIYHLNECTNKRYESIFVHYARKFARRTYKRCKDIIWDIVNDYLIDNMLPDEGEFCREEYLHHREEYGEEPNDQEPYEE